MKLRSLARWTFAVGAALVSAAAAQDPADTFVERLDSFPGLEPKAAGLIRATWAECDGCDGEEFLTQGLAVLSPAFRDGLDAYDADRYLQAAAIMGKLSGDPNQFLSVNASAYEVKSLVQSERLLEALHRIEAYFERFENPSGHTYLDGEIHFLHGYCLLSDLQYTKAAAALEAFIGRYPGASQRLVVAAQQMLVELQNRQPGRIGEVVDLMDFCGRRLRVADAGDNVHDRQQRVIDILDRMIEEAEENEKEQSCDKNSGGGSGGGQGDQSPSNPMQESQLPGGSGSDKADLRAGRRANPAEVWGSMPPAERAKVLQALRDSFPSRYRQLVEQYYEDLAKKP